MSNLLCVSFIVSARRGAALNSGITFMGRADWIYRRRLGWNGLLLAHPNVTARCWCRLKCGVMCITHTGVIAVPRSRKCRPDQHRCVPSTEDLAGAAAFTSRVPLGGDESMYTPTTNTPRQRLLTTWTHCWFITLNPFAPVFYLLIRRSIFWQVLFPSYDCYSSLVCMFLFFSCWRWFIPEGLLEILSRRALN